MFCYLKDGVKVKTPKHNSHVTKKNNNLKIQYFEILNYIEFI